MEYIWVNQLANDVWPRAYVLISYPISKKMVLISQQIWLNTDSDFDISFSAQWENRSHFCVLNAVISQKNCRNW